MSLSHHGGSDSQEMLELKKRLEAEKRFIDERFEQAQRRYPNGRISHDDDGETAIAVCSDPDKQLVRIDFGTPTAWIAMTPQQAIDMAQLMIRHARSVSTTPLKLQLH